MLNTAVFFFFSLRFFVLFFHSDFACYFTSINFLFCFVFGFDVGVKCFCNFFHFVFLFHSDLACYFTSINFLFCFTLFSILKFSRFDYVEIKITKIIKEP